MKIAMVLLFLLGLGGTMSCGQSGKSFPETQPESKEFQLPTVPVTITVPEERADYLAKNYWVHFDFSDTAYIHMPKVTEQAFVNYIDVLKLTDKERAYDYISSLMKAAEKDSLVFHYFAGLAEKYLYDPNSPFQNEQLYIPVLETLVSSKLTGDADCIRFEALLTLAQKNQPGSVTTNFTYTLADGRKRQLRNFRSPYLLLFLNDIDCENCKQTMKELAESDVINGLINKHTLAILSLYTQNDTESWNKKLSDMPDNWVNAYDEKLQISNEELYDLKAMPTLYLLDKEKKVLLKDAELKDIVLFLESLKDQP